jgi:hypothetical protein
VNFSKERKYIKERKGKEIKKIERKNNDYINNA